MVYNVFGCLISEPLLWRRRSIWQEHGATEHGVRALAAAALLRDSRAIFQQQGGEALSEPGARGLLRRLLEPIPLEDRFSELAGLVLVKGDLGWHRPVSIRFAEKAVKCLIVQNGLITDGASGFCPGDFRPAPASCPQSGPLLTPVSVAFCKA